MIYGRCYEVVASFMHSTRFNSWFAEAVSPAIFISPKQSARGQCVPLEGCVLGFGPSHGNRGP